ncbi:hypothetical protein CAPTEDRAFT_112141 [Capitella teleta]|uniref:Small monomeric GTPase n=1 Tax=Capitella teleta TaxID=283909 RepID=R7U9V4_CAPTE|nr:hypothetical protein CAPTEDRAFT_195024 [Capitella teleta]ELU06347.1 hypothetical protein CAPTEDRAFT_112141 [Capitella teleta]|eukprot:ELU00593.1 hypothetical protein CAPTEDRAFT_195024 [Capitella teleta]
MKDRIKCVIIGDTLVGKTCMLSVLVDKVFPRGYVPQTVFKQFTSNLMIDKESALLDLRDTAGAQEYDRLRPLSYPGADVFIVVFAVPSDVKHSNVVDRWLPEIRHHCPEVPFILVGNKTDLRESDAATKSTAKLGLNAVSKLDGEKLALELEAIGYLECSALMEDGVTEVFDAAVRAARESREPSPKPRAASSKCCVS